MAKTSAKKQQEGPRPPCALCRKKLNALRYLAIASIVLLAADVLLTFAR